LVERPDDREIRDKLIKIETLLEHILTMLDEGKASHKDHDLRIRVLEQRKYISPSGLWTAVCGAIGTGVALTVLLDRLTRN